MNTSSTAATLIGVILGLGLLAVISFLLCVVAGVVNLVRWVREVAPYFHQEDAPDSYSRQGGEMKTGVVIGIVRPPDDLTLVRVAIDSASETYVFRVSERHQRTKQPIRLELEDQLTWGHDLSDATRLDWTSAKCPQAQPLRLMSHVMLDLPVSTCVNSR